MESDFDPYLQWLGIPPEKQPPDYYLLLGLPRFESNQQLIEAAAENRMVYLRTFQSGPHGNDSQQILNEIAQAKICLLDQTARSTYDNSLQSIDSLLPSASGSSGVKSKPLSGNNLAGDPTQQKTTIKPWRPFAIMSLLVLISFGAFYVFGVWLSDLQTKEDARLRQEQAQLEDEDQRRLNQLNEAELANLPPGIRRVDRLYSLHARNTNKLDSNLVIEKVGDQESISGWTDSDRKSIWELSVSYPGFYRVEFSYSLEEGPTDPKFIVVSDGVKKRNSLRTSAGDIISDECIVMFKEKGTSTVEVFAEGVDEKLNLFGLEITPRL